jgi:hypothetical protein
LDFSSILYFLFFKGIKSYELVLKLIEVVVVIDVICAVGVVIGLGDDEDNFGIIDITSVLICLFPVLAVLMIIVVDVAGDDDATDIFLCGEKQRTPNSESTLEMELFLVNVIIHSLEYVQYFTQKNTL